MTAPQPSVEDRAVLVTGGAGFVGSHLVDALVEANEVCVLEDFSSGERTRVPGEVDVFEGDVREAAVVECAAIVGFRYPSNRLMYSLTALTSST